MLCVLRCIAAQSLLETRTPGQVNSTVATQKALCAPPPINVDLTSSSIRNNDKQSGNTDKNTDEDESDKRAPSNTNVNVAAVDPFEGNFELKGVGKSRLRHFSTSELCATLRARKIAHRSNLQMNEIIAKLSAWKREVGRSQREASGTNSGDVNDGDSEDDNENGTESTRTQGVDPQPVPPPLFQTPTERPNRNATSTSAPKNNTEIQLLDGSNNTSPSPVTNTNGPALAQVRATA